MQYLTIDMRRETIERLKHMNDIKENLKDAIAELEEVQKRDPLISTKGTGDKMGGNSGVCDHHVAVMLSSKESALVKRVSELKTMVNDYNRACRFLSKNELTVLRLKYERGYSYTKIAEEMGYGVDSIKKFNSKLLSKMESHFLWI